MEDPLPPSPYKTLNVPKDATLATIRSAHRKLVLSCHPDKVQDESAKKVKAEQFHQVQQAYEILSDERKRQRYDEKVKLEELRAEMENERGPPLPRRAPSYEYGPPRNGFSPTSEMRGGRMYETREPKPAQSARYSDEDYPTTKYDARPSYMKHDDYYPSYPSRRTSGRAQEEKKKARDLDDERDRKRRERDAEAFARDQRTKKRDKEKKQDTETKARTKHSPYIDDGSDSEFDNRRYPNKREIPSKYKYEELPRRSREEPRKSSKYDPRAYDDEELSLKISAQQEYMSRSREAVEIEPLRRPARARAGSNLDTRKTPPPPPQVDSGKRPSARRGFSSRPHSPPRSSKKDKRSSEIVESPSSRKPSLPSASTDPKGLKGFFSSSRREPQRTAAYQPAADLKHPSMRRSETMPIDRMRRGEAVPLKSSNLKNMKAPSDYGDSSDSDSEMTEEIYSVRPNPHQKSTSYRVHEDEDEFVLEPEEIIPTRSARESSPKTRHSSDRPTMAPRGSTTRTPPMPRVSSYAFPQDERSPRPGISRTESARPTPLKSHQSARGERLFGEQSPIEETFKSRHSPKIHPEDRFTKSYSRRGSEEVDRDAYPGSKFRSRPQYGRNETAC